MKLYLVGVSIPLKNMKVNWDDDIPNIWKNKKCSKPPTRYFFGGFWSYSLFRWFSTYVESRLYNYSELQREKTGWLMVVGMAGMAICIAEKPTKGTGLTKKGISSFEAGLTS
jgi:hypothetical protein